MTCSRGNPKKGPAPRARWMDYPARGYLVRHPHDSSLQTFRGHSVTQTLIRAYFSPLATTAQRYVYAGSADGAVRIWGTPPARAAAPPHGQRLPALWAGALNPVLLCLSLQVIAAFQIPASNTAFDLRRMSMQHREVERASQQGF